MAEKLYEVRHADDVGIQPDDPWAFSSEVKARDPDEAAEKYAESYDQDDYYLSKSESNEITVEVRLATEPAKTWRFLCRASHSVSYYADEVFAHARPD